MYNVTSGPAVYPNVVLEKIAQGIINFEGKEISTLEIGHRSEIFFAIRDELISLTKELLDVPDDFSILYLQGGGRLHFAQIPMNFLGASDTAQFIDTGYWSSKAVEYSSSYGLAEIIATSQQDSYQHIPSVDVSELKGKYLQYCSNNTIYGTQSQDLPKANIPVVVDMSSDIFSKQIDFKKVDLVLACAQKNFGPAGLSLLIIKNDFLDKACRNVPAVFDYKHLTMKNSNYNTPPIFQVCASLEMLRWIKEKGGVVALESETRSRAKLLYDAIDKSELVTNTINTSDRSMMNLVFDAVNQSEEGNLLDRFSKARIMGIKGHKARGGFRVGNYLGQVDNAIAKVMSCL